MDPLLDRIAGRRVELVEQAGRLRKELAEVEAELARVASAEQVVTQLLAEDEPDEQGGLAPQVPARAAGSSGAGSVGGRAGQGLTVPHHAVGVTAEDLPGDYRQLMRIVAEEQQAGPAGAGVACKRVTVKLGLEAVPRHTEGVRV